LIWDKSFTHSQFRLLYFTWSVAYEMLVSNAYCVSTFSWH
jgi:hypothetical protein